MIITSFKYYKAAATMHTPPLWIDTCFWYEYTRIINFKYQHERLRVSSSSRLFSLISFPFVIYLVLCIMVRVCTVCVGIRALCVYMHGEVFVHCQHWKSKQALEWWRACEHWAQLVSRGSALCYRLPTCLCVPVDSGKRTTLIILRVKTW